MRGKINDRRGGTVSARGVPSFMGFDNNDPRPIIDPSKRTTKVNICVAVGVLVFLAIGALAIASYAHVHH
jgi:preprotein translocase subunit Sec61beta